MNAGISVALARRASLGRLGATGLAGLAAPVTAGAKKNKTNKQARKRCKRQKAQCSDFFTGGCGENPDCLELLACCEFAAQCDAAEFLGCLIS